MSSVKLNLPDFAQLLEAKPDAVPGEFPALVAVRDTENNRIISRRGRDLKHAARRVRAQLGGRFEEIDEEGGAQ